MPGQKNVRWKKKKKTIGELNNSNILREKSMNYIRLRG
jgi:hypothetical protein